MSKRTCVICGATPAAGFASIWSASAGERWYCHGDDDTEPTCYERAGWDLTPTADEGEK